MTAASNSEARKRTAGIAVSNPTAPEPTGTLEGAPGANSEALTAQNDSACTGRVVGWPSNAAQTHVLLEALLDDEYGAQGWNDLGSLRRIARAVNQHSAAAIREHVTAALDEIEKRIAKKLGVTSRALRLVRDYRQEQGR